MVKNFSSSLRKQPIFKMVGLVVALIFIGLIFLLDISQLKRELNSVQKRVKSMSNKIQLYPPNPKPNLEKKLTTADPILFSATIVKATEVMVSLEKIMFTLQIVPHFFKPLSPKEDNWGIKYSFSISFISEYKNLLYFLVQLLQFEELITIDRLAIQKPEAINSNKLKIVLSFTLYHSKLKLADQVPVQDWLQLVASTAGRNIFKPISLDSQLDWWGVDEFRFLGIIKQDQETWGLISDPTDKVHQVAIGNRIGKENSEIIAINSKQILTHKPTFSLKRDDQVCE